MTPKVDLWPPYLWTHVSVYPQPHTWIHMNTCLLIIKQCWLPSFWEILLWLDSSLFWLKVALFPCVRHSLLKLWEFLWKKKTTQTLSWFTFLLLRQTLWPKASWGGKGLFPFTVAVHHKGSQGRNLRHKWRQRSWRNAAYWLAIPGLLSLLSFVTQDHEPVVALPRVGWALPYRSLIKKTHYRLAYRQSGRYFFQLCFFPDDSSLCQADKKTSQGLLLPSCPSYCHLFWFYFVFPQNNSRGKN